MTALCFNYYYLNAFIDDKWRLRVDRRVVHISLRWYHDNLCAERKSTQLISKHTQKVIFTILG